MNNEEPKESWKKRWFRIIFSSNTRAGQLFDIFLLVAILLSLLAVMLETVPYLQERYHRALRIAEWSFTFIFTVEYIARLMVTKRPWKYALSFYGIIDLLSFLPSYLAFIFTGGQAFMVVRSLRLLRVFRVLKMVRFLGEAKVLATALRASRAKITVFIVTVTCLTFIMGALMYLIEGPENGFASIPVSIYWCIVTLTTVGYGDISPQTPLGQIVASIIMIMGYGIIAVPTGIVTSELSKQSRPAEANDKICPNCKRGSQAEDAWFCKYCGYQF